MDVEDAPAPQVVLERVSWTVRRADLAIQALKDPGLREVGVPNSHYSLLMHVHVFPGLNGAELARRLGVTTQAVALLATKLEARGFLERRAHPRHRSVQEFHLTSAGREALHAADVVVTDVDDQVRAVLGEERSDQLHEMLTEIVQALGPASWSATDG